MSFHLIQPSPAAASLPPYRFMADEGLAALRRSPSPAGRPRGIMSEGHRPKAASPPRQRAKMGIHTDAAFGRLTRRRRCGRCCQRRYARDARQLPRRMESGQRRLRCFHAARPSWRSARAGEGRKRLSAFCLAWTAGTARDALTGVGIRSRSPAGVVGVARMGCWL